MVVCALRGAGVYFHIRVLARGLKKDYNKTNLGNSACPFAMGIGMFL